MFHVSICWGFFSCLETNILIMLMKALTEDLQILESVSWLICRGLGLFLFRETHFIQTLNSSSRISEKVSDHKFRQKWCPVTFIIWFHLLPYSWEILQEREGRLELYYLQFSLQKTWRVTKSQLTAALSSPSTFWEPRWMHTSRIGMNCMPC